MTIRIDLPQGQARERAEDLFDALATTRLLLGTPGDGVGGVAMYRFYRYATDASAVDDELAAALERDAALRGRFETLLARTAVFRLPQLAAASTGEAATREGSGYRIRLQPSQAEPDQTYIIFELDEAGQTPPRTIFVCRPDRPPLRHALPDAIGGVVQILVEQDSPLLQALRDLDAEVFLR